MQLNENKNFWELLEFLEIYSHLLKDFQNLNTKHQLHRLKCESTKTIIPNHQLLLFYHLGILLINHLDQLGHKHAMMEMKLEISIHLLPLKEHSETFNKNQKMKHQMMKLDLIPLQSKVTMKKMINLNLWLILYRLNTETIQLAKSKRIQQKYWAISVLKEALLT